MGEKGKRQSHRITYMTSLLGWIDGFSAEHGEWGRRGVGETRGSSKNVAVALGTASDLIDLSGGGGGEDDEDDGRPGQQYKNP